ncbi:c-type cytochrome [Sulfitobacter sp.]|jgi:cytochrome c|uniref:c-type cytochrome n=1 Tax=Sulfitobacter sp. TaxID=1903071 RepID=UPI0030020215
MTMTKTFSIAVLVAALATPSLAENHSTPMEMMAPGLMMPEMNAEEGRRLFVSKGCVVCHSINGVGGTDAPMGSVAKFLCLFSEMEI